MTHPNRLPLLIVALLPALASATPPQAFELKRSEIGAGDVWSVRMSTRVEQDPGAVDPEAGLAAPGAKPAVDFVETAANYKVRVLEASPDGTVKLETRHAPQKVVMVTEGERSQETAPGRVVVESGAAAELLAPTEVGPCSFLERATARVGERWTTHGTLMIGGVAPVTLRIVYAVEGLVERDGERLLKITSRGEGHTPAEGGATIEVETQGVVFLNPDRADRPRKATLVYRLRIRGGEGPDVATRTTIKLESKKTS